METATVQEVPQEKEEHLLQMIIKEQAWEDIIYNIVSLENLDPWDIDIVKLAGSFVKYIKSMKTIDFRIPAKVILVAAILLKLKVEYLSPFKGKDDNGNSLSDSFFDTDNYDLLRQQMQGMELKPPMKRRFKRKVTLDELVDALQKAMKVGERRDERKEALGRRLRMEVDFFEEDIDQRINRMLGDINGLLLKLKSEKVKFSEIVNKWERDEIIAHFVPLLHLSMRGDVVAEQEDFFKEIYIQKRAA